MLTKKIWISALNSSESLDPIEDIEMRFVLKKNKNTEIKSISNALEGKSKLTDDTYIPFVKPKVVVQHK